MNELKTAIRRRLEVLRNEKERRYGMVSSAFELAQLLALLERASAPGADLERVLDDYTAGRIQPDLALVLPETRARVVAQHLR